MRPGEQGVVSIGTCADRAAVTVCGRVRSVTLRPHLLGAPTLEAEIYDDSGAITLVWLGRRQIEGIRPGARLRATGRICRRSDERAIFNPRYDLLPG
jgi:hypothetical protein